MKTVMLPLLAALMFAPFGQAEDAKALYKSKCASCHGATGAGRPALKRSSLLTDECKKQTDEQLADAIAKGPKSKSSHAYEKKGLTRDQIHLLVQHVRELQKASP